jgi:hypothetical protein
LFICIDIKKIFFFYICTLHTSKCTYKITLSTVLQLLLRKNYFIYFFNILISLYWYTWKQDIYLKIVSLSQTLIKNNQLCVQTRTLRNIIKINKKTNNTAANYLLLQKHYSVQFTLRLSSIFFSDLLLYYRWCYANSPSKFNKFKLNNWLVNCYRGQFCVSWFLFP